MISLGLCARAVPGKKKQHENASEGFGPPREGGKAKQLSPLM